MQNIETKETRYKKAFKEIYIIINDLSEELYSKIPKSFISLVKENMDLKYNVSLEKIEQKGEMPETKAIMALMYRDYLCDKETRDKLIEQEKAEITKEYEKYNNMFKNKENTIQEEPKTANQLMVIEEKRYIKIFNKIKNFFFKK